MCLPKENEDKCFAFSVDQQHRAVVVVIDSDIFCSLCHGTVDIVRSSASKNTSVQESGCKGSKCFCLPLTAVLAFHLAMFHISWHVCMIVHIISSEANCSVIENMAKGEAVARL